MIPEDRHLVAMPEGLTPRSPVPRRRAWNARRMASCIPRRRLCIPRRSNELFCGQKNSGTAAAKKLAHVTGLV